MYNREIQKVVQIRKNIKDKNYERETLGKDKQIF